MIFVHRLTLRDDHRRTSVISISVVHTIGVKDIIKHIALMDLESSFNAWASSNARHPGSCKSTLKVRNVQVFVYGTIQVNTHQNIHHFPYQTSSPSALSKVSFDFGGRAVGGVPCRDSTTTGLFVVLLVLFLVRGVLS